MAGNIRELARIGYEVQSGYNVHLGVALAGATPWEQLPSAEQETYIEQARTLVGKDREVRVPVEVGSPDDDGDVTVEGVGEALFDIAVLAAAKL